MAVKRLEHVGVVVSDLAAAVGFFTALGLTLEGETSVSGEAVDRITALPGAHSRLAFMATPDGQAQLELIEYVAPLPETEPVAPQSNTPGLNHLLFSVDDIEAAIAAAREHGGELVGELVRWGDSFWLCYLRGPAGIIVELAQRID